MDISPQCIWPLSAVLAEGPVWIAQEQAVYFVDIKGKKIHRYSVNGGAQQTWSAPNQPGFLAPLNNTAFTGQFICGLSDGLYVFDSTASTFSLLAPVDAHTPGNRLNDGFADANGNLWFGTMDDGEKNPTGSLYSYSQAAQLTCHDSGYVITNGPALSPDGLTLYHTDTLLRTIYAFNCDAAGQLSHKRVFLALGKQGYPDGMAVDSEGCLWVAYFGGWRIDRFSPTGGLLGSVQFPCANITKLVFGGDDGRTVYVTTAAKGLSQQDRQLQPLAGGLFTFRSPVPGLPQNYLKKTHLTPG